MTQRVQVPKFGNWEGEATIPYTVYFDKAVGGHGKGKAVAPSGHNLEKLCNGSSSVEADSDDGMEKLSEMEQPNWEVPKFGDWDGVGEDPQYTVYFEKVGRKGSGGRGLYDNYPHNTKSTEKNYSPARKVSVEGRSPQHPKSNKGSVVIHEKPKLQSEGRKKIPTKRSPDSRHGSAASIPRNSYSETKSRSPSNFDISEESRMGTKPRQKEVVVPGTVLRNSDSKNRNDTLESQSVSDSNSSYHKGSKPMKKQNANVSLSLQSSTFRRFYGCFIIMLMILADMLLSMG